MTGTFDIKRMRNEEMMDWMERVILRVLFLLCFKGEKGCYVNVSFKDVTRDSGFVYITETTRIDYKQRNEKPAAVIALIMHSEA